jgi:hypothetical protein
MLVERFELELFGEGIERRYRKMRPEVEAMPWGTLRPDEYPETVILAARRTWTGAAFQEYRTGIACAATLRALLEARAPLDLIAMATRFPLDELVHVELCSRLAMELGGGTEIIHDATFMTHDPPPDLHPLVRAADLVVHNFCVGEALSIPLLRGTWHAAKHPLPKAVLARIVRDEAAHGAFGWSFLDWAVPLLEKNDLEHLGRVADVAIKAVYTLWADLRKRKPVDASDPHALGWMQSEAYLALAERSLEGKVLQPLRERGIPLGAS